MGDRVYAQPLSPTSSLLNDTELAQRFSKKFLESYCFGCHGTASKDKKKVEGDFDFEKLDWGPFESLTQESAQQWQVVVEQLTSRSMPPDDQQQPSDVDRAKMISVIKTALKNSGKFDLDSDRKMLFPEYGNWVDHHSLFDSANIQPGWSPSRVWKRNPNQFDNLVQRGMGLGTGRYGRPHQRLGKIKQPFTLEEKSGISDYAAIALADSATLGTMLRNAEIIVDQLLAESLYQLQEKRNGRTPDSELPKDKKGRPIRPRFAKTPKPFADVILSVDSPTDQEISNSITFMFETVADRKLEQPDIERYVRFFRQLESESDVSESLRMTLISIAISPPAIYRSELGSGTPDSHGRRMLSSADLAFAIAYALTDSPPDPMLLDAAFQGRLTSAKDVEREVKRIWDDDSIEKPRILRFFHEFFGYTSAPRVFKDLERFERGKDYRQVPEKLVADADQLVLHIVKTDRQVLKELLTTEKYFVGHSGDNEAEQVTQEMLKKFYDYFKNKPWKDYPYQTPAEDAKFARSIGKIFAHPNGNVVKGWMRYLTMCDQNGITPMPTSRQHDFLVLYDLRKESFSFPVKQPFVLAEGKRVGILMHPAWLLAHSLNLDNDPIRRGKWIREKLLAGIVPDLPITVDATIPEAPEQSLRQRFSVTRQVECWRCHKKMNPLGMPFEAFDDFGRHRAGIEKLHGKGKSLPVDSTGILQGTGEPDLDGPVNDPVEMMRRIARSRRAQQSFVRHAFRYWMARNETVADAGTLIDAEKAYAEQDGSFKALVVSLLTSDAFLYRK